MLRLIAHIMKKKYLFYCSCNYFLRCSIYINCNVYISHRLPILFFIPKGCCRLSLSRHLTPSTISPVKFRSKSSRVDSVVGVCVNIWKLDVFPGDGGGDLLRQQYITNTYKHPNYPDCVIVVALGMKHSAYATNEECTSKIFL